MATMSTEDFILKMELSAKKILKEQAKKARESSRLEATSGLYGNSTSKSAHPELALSIPSNKMSKSISFGASLSPLKSRPLSGHGTKRKNDGSMLSQSHNGPLGSSSIKKSLVLEKLKESPYSALLKSVESLAPLSTSKEKVLSETQYSAETTGAMRQHANNVLNKSKSNILQISHQQRSRTLKQKVNAKFHEVQGPIDWSSNSLRVKYRGETEREDAWNESNSNATKSQTLFEYQELVVPIVHVERHPLYKLYHQMLANENHALRISVANRLQMKRFVCDIQEIWLSNLTHLPEHAVGAKSSSASSPANSIVRHSLRNRRDKAAILAMESQIQSVSFKRAMQKAFITTQMPPPTVALDYTPAAPPSPVPPLQIAPLFETLVVPFYSQDTDLALHRTHLYSIERVIPGTSVKPEGILWRLLKFDRRDCGMEYNFCREADIIRQSGQALDKITLDEAKDMASSIIDRCYGGDVSPFQPSRELEEEWATHTKFPFVCLSLVASGAELQTSQVPGACEFGKRGLWLNQESKMPLAAREEQQYPTRVALRFFRDATASSSDTVLVNATLFIDLFNFVTDTSLAWEEGSAAPLVAPSEDVERMAYLPRIKAFPTSLLANPVVSPIHDRISEQVIIHSLYRRMKMVPNEGLLNRRSSTDISDTDALHTYLVNTRLTGSETTQDVSNRGFRSKLFVELLDIDPNVGTKIFGISKSAALANVPGMNTRNLWHNTFPVLDDICRARTPKDYFYIVSGEKPSYNTGPNISLSFAITMLHNEFKDVVTRKATEFESEYADIKEKRMMRRRRDALDAKIESTEIAVRIKKKELKSKAVPMNRSIGSVISETSTVASKGQVLAKESEVESDFEEPAEFWLPSVSEEYSEVATGGAVPQEQKYMQVRADATIDELNTKIHDSDRLQRNNDMFLLDELGKSNDISGKELLEVLSRRLGITPLEQRVVIEKIDDINTPERAAPQSEDAAYDSDDDMFNTEDDGLHVISSNPKFIEKIIGKTPQTAEEQALIVKEERNLLLSTALVVSDKSIVPPLPFGRHEKDLSLVKTADAPADQQAWRRLPKHEIVPAQFFGHFRKLRTLGPDMASSNLVNKPVYLLPIVSREYVPEDFDIPYASLFVEDASKEMTRAVNTLDKNLRREEELARLVPPADEELGAQEMTSIEMYLNRQQIEAKKQATAHQAEQLLLSSAELRARAIEKAIMAAKTSNVGLMEDALDEELDGGNLSPDTTTDELGNTLLILASQQGSKRMCKLLLRRGANINRQNTITGNTVLHFCMAFSHKDLAKYLISKGADDTILNAEGYTCYEAQIMHNDI